MRACTGTAKREKSRKKNTMNKKGFSKTGIVLIGSMLVCLLICLCVVIPGGFGDSKSSKLDDEGTPNMKTLVEEGTPVFLVDKRDSTKKLMQDFDDGNVTGFSVETTKKDGDSVIVDTGSSDNEQDILAVYKALKNLVITEEPDQKGAGSESVILSFRMKDGGQAEFVFPARDMLQIDNSIYQVANSEALWQAIEEDAK